MEKPPDEPAIETAPVVDENAAKAAAEAFDLGLMIKFEKLLYFFNEVLILRITGSKPANSRNWRRIDALDKQLNSIMQSMENVRLMIKCATLFDFSHFKYLWMIFTF